MTMEGRICERDEF